MDKKAGKKIVKKGSESCDNIERLEIMEENCGVSFEGLYAVTTDLGYDLPYECYVYGEVHSVDGTSIKNNIIVHALAFNDAGQVIGSGGQTIYSEGFLALEPLLIRIFKLLSKPSKVRVYPKQ